MKVEICKILLISIGVFSLFICEARENQDTEAFDNIKSVIDNCRDNSSLDKDGSVQYLSLFLLKLSVEKPSDSSERLKGLYKKLYKHAQTTLIHIPGHAEYQLRKIDTARGILKPEVIVPSATVGYSIISNSDFSEISPFEVLSRLPSSETVSVPGVLINVDETTGDRIMLRHITSSSDPLPYGQLAALAIERLIDDPPVPMGPGFVYARDIKIWRVWFEEVKAGTRKFQFKVKAAETAIEKK